MKVCFAGAGSIGKRHITNLYRLCKDREIECHIHLLRSTSRSLDGEINSMIERTTEELDMLDDHYDAVFITNPTHRHYDTVLKFLDRTDCFFIEKPVFHCTDVKIDDLLSSGKFYYVACPLRYTGVLMAAREILAGEKILSARAICSSYLPEWRKNTDYRDTYSAHKEQGGGVRIDLIHEWDYLTKLFGFPEEVYSIDGKFSSLEIDAEDLAVYIAKYDEMVIELHLDYFGRQTRRCLEVITEENIFVFDIANSRIIKNDLLLVSFQEDGNQKYMREMECFIDSILGNRKSLNDLEHALRVQRLAKNS